MKKIKFFAAGFLAATALSAFGFAACDGNNASSSDGADGQSATVVSIDGGTVSGDKIFILADKDVTSLALGNKVVCSKGSVWKLYYDQQAQQEIPSKVAVGQSGSLADGNNLFYLVASSKDGSLVNVYEVTVHKSYAAEIKYYDGETLLKTETAYTGEEFSTDYVPTIEGYTFNDWNYEKAVLWEDLTLYADKTANEYTVTYDVNGGDTLTETKKTVTYGEEFSFVKPTKTGYAFLGWYDGQTPLTDGEGKSLSAWKNASDVTAKAEWQANEYTLTANKTDGGTVTGGGKYLYGESVTLTATTAAGYTWLGWYDGDTLLTTEASYTFTIVAKDTTYTAKWTYYTLTTNTNLEEAGSYSQYTDKKVSVGAQHTVTATTKQFNTWLGWYDGETLLTTELSYTFTMPAENVTYTAKWACYTLTVGANMKNSGRYDVECGWGTTVEADGVASGKVEATAQVELTAESKLGYTWLGWYDGDTLLTAELNYIFTMPAEDVSYTAKWKLAEEMQNFYFTSTYTECSIKDVKDDTVTEIIVPDYVTQIQSGAFEDCTALTSIKLPFIGGSKNSSTYASKFGYIFGYTAYQKNPPYYGCTEIFQYTDESVSPNNPYKYYFYKIPQTIKSVTVTGGTIAQNAFYNCSFLENITLEGAGFSSGNPYVGDYAFYNCTGLKELALPSTVTNVGKYAFEGCSGLETITLGKSLTSIGEYAFKGCRKVKMIAVPPTVKRIGEGAFSDCGGLEILSLPFAGCVVEEANGSWQYPFGYFFGTAYYNNCVATQQEYWKVGAKNTTYTPVTYNLPASLKSVVLLGGEIEDGVFIGCTNVERIKISPYATKIGESAFSGCKNLTEIVVPDTVKTMGGNAFSSCDALQKAVIGKGVISISRYAFSNCKNLTEVQLSKGLQSISEGAFNNCKSLKHITIPDGVAMILKEAFLGCEGLETVVLPKTLTNVGGIVFGYCYKLTNVYYTGSEAEWQALAIDYVGDATVYYYSESEPALNADGTTYDGNYWRYVEGVITVWTKEN